jgi:hypothetical protein
VSNPSSNDKSPKRCRPPKRKPAASKPASKSAAKPAKTSAKPTPAPKSKITAPAIKKSAPRPAAAALLGLGLDNTDGHKRITTGEQFAILGGSEQTHDRMTEIVVKTFEELKKRGKHLSQVERAELAEIIHKATPA